MTFSQKSVFKKTQSNLAKMGSFGRVWDYLNLLKKDHEGVIYIGF